MSLESKPSILLSLPPELWHHIMKEVQHCKDTDGSTTAEEDVERYQTLRRAALAHRILRPFAQEELLRELHLLSKGRLRLLFRSLAGSSQLAGYAQRTEFVHIFEKDEDRKEGMPDELLGKLPEMCCHVKGLYVQNSPVLLSVIGRLIPSESAI